MIVSSRAVLRFGRPATTRSTASVTTTTGNQATTTMTKLLSSSSYSSSSSSTTSYQWMVVMATKSNSFSTLSKHVPDGTGANFGSPSCLARTSSPTKHHRMQASIFYDNNNEPSDGMTMYEYSIKDNGYRNDISFESWNNYGIRNQSYSSIRWYSSSSRNSSNVEREEGDLSKIKNKNRQQEQNVDVANEVKEGNDDGTKSNVVVDMDETSERLLYTAPLAGMITRLKIVSITSCVMSLVGLPLLIFIKSGGIFCMPTTQQLGLGGMAFVGATGSTLALHYVFGPYVVEIKQIPIRKCHYEKDKATSDSSTDDDNHQGGNSKESNHSTSTEHLFQASTRSIFGLWTNEYVFNPKTDVTSYSGGIRPFANFVVQKQGGVKQNETEANNDNNNDDTSSPSSSSSSNGTVLYVHPELLDETTRSLLLSHLPLPSSEEEEVNYGTKDKGSKGTLTKEQKKKNDDDDGLF